MWVPLCADSNFQDKSQILNDIINGKYSALIIRNFYDKKSCNTITNRIKKFSYFDYGDGIIKKIGVFLLAYINKKSDYFIDAEKVRPTLRQIFYNLDDPRKKIHRLISNMFPTKIVTAAEEDGKKYSCGIIRLHEKGDRGPLHRDNVSFEARDFYVSSFEHQLSCILYLNQSEKGGELLIYRQSWKKNDEKYREIGFGYSNKVISKCKESSLIKANSGDLVIFNPRHYHEILPIAGKSKRITLSLFLAFSKMSNKVVTWS